MWTTSKEIIKTIQPIYSHKCSHIFKCHKLATKPTNVWTHIFTAYISHSSRTHLSKIAVFVIRNYSSEVEQALFPNVRDFIVSGHRQTCSFSRGPSQHFTWLDSICSESCRALITVQRCCKVCMSACARVLVCAMRIERKHTLKIPFVLTARPFKIKDVLILK